MASVIAGMLIIIYYLLTSLCGTVIFMSPAFIFMLCSPKLFRWWNDLMYWWWSAFITGIYEVFFDTKVFITGDLPQDPKERCIIIMNHRTRQDWLLFWAVSHRYFAVENIKIILRGDLKYVPGVGWGMQMLNFIFLKRKWEKDRIVFSRTLDYFNDIDYPAKIIIFPEGTNYEEISALRGYKYANIHGLQQYEYCLHPRVTGFAFLVSKLREKRLDAVYDVTVAYPKTMPQSEMTLLKGNIPEELHYQIKRYDNSELPEDQEELGEWCKKRWAEKEDRLRQFYTVDKTFDGNNTPDTTGKFKFILATLFWILIVPISMYLTYYNTILRYHVIIVSSLYFICGYMRGLEVISIDWYYYWYGKKKRN
ncbi:Lysocardiolipin acyltransferase 1 [Trichoplax sp. H2]|nr:Lysocardiolipin acyltransferase 1 [Trichoplax sp. H2]|eukprot:RDD40308.1 Lysocardiolipin acyltransferase 1 [Trichoplax sp. H2]